MTIQWF